MKVSKEPLVSAAALRKRIAELAAEISRDYVDQEMVLIAVLKGAMPFAADLMRALAVDPVLDFVRAKSYEGTASTGDIRFTLLPETPLAGKQILLVEDILDTGQTAAAILERLRAQAPASLRLCTLLDKPVRREIAVAADYAGFVIDDHFVVGYGLDYEERYRALDSVFILET